MRGLLVAFVSAQAFRLDAKTDLTSLADVITKLQDVRGELQNSYYADQKSYVEAERWGEATMTKLARHIARGEAEKKKFEEREATLQTEIEAQGEEIETLTNKMTDNRDEKTNAHTKYTEDLADIDEKITDLENAETALRGAFETVRATLSSFAVKHSDVKKVVAKAQAAISKHSKVVPKAMLMQLEEGPAPVAGGEVVKVNKHLGSLDALLEKILDSLDEQVYQAKNQRTSIENAWQLQQQVLDDEHSALDAEKIRTSTAKGDNEAELGTVESDLESTKTQLNTDRETRGQLKTNLAVRKDEAEDRFKRMKDELEAFDQAIQYLKEAAGLGIDERQQPQNFFFLQMPKAPKVLSIKDAAAHLAKFKNFNSLASTLSAIKIQGKASKSVRETLQFIKRKIENLLRKLEDEAATEGSHLVKCQNIMTKLIQDDDEAGQRITDLDADIIQATTDRDSAKQAKEDAMDEITTEQENFKEAHNLRMEEAAENRRDIKDFKDAANACENALRVLKRMWDKNSGATLTTAHSYGDIAGELGEEDKTANLFSSAHTAAENHGAVEAILTQAITEYNTLETETEGDDTQQASEFVTTETNYKAAVKEQEGIRDRKAELERTKERELATLSKELTAEKIRKANINSQFRNLHCHGDHSGNLQEKTLQEIETEMNEGFDARKLEREAEVSALTDAMGTIQSMIDTM